MPTPTPNLQATVAAAVLATIQALPANTPTATTSPSPSPTPTLTDRREGLAPLHSFIATSGYNPAVDIRQIVQVQSQIDRTFRDRYQTPYYGGFPGLSKLYEPHDANKLQAALSDIKGLTRWEYAIDVFDCSNMTALTQFYLANAGFKTVMVVGQDPDAFDGHAWVVVLVSNPSPEAIPIETTTPGGPTIPRKGVTQFPSRVRGKTILQSYDDYITKGWAIQDIYQATVKFGEKEFNWWDVAQIDWPLLQRSSPTPPPASPTATPTPARPPSFTVSPSSSSPGTVVTITGQDFTPNGTISVGGIVIGGSFGNFAPVAINGQGGFTYGFAVTVGLPAGTHIVVVTDAAGRSARGVITIAQPQATPAPRITLSPSSTQAGSTITISGFNFSAYGTIRSADVVLGGTPSVGPTFNIDGTGGFALRLTLPANWSPGTYTIVVTDSSGRQGRASVTVSVPATPTPTTVPTPPIK